MAKAFWQKINWKGLILGWLGGWITYWLFSVIFNVDVPTYARFAVVIIMGYIGHKYIK